MELNSAASALVGELVEGYPYRYGFGAMTCAVYDTAWLAMVEKVVDGKANWLFPSSFQWLLDNQTENGGWEAKGLETDGILNTAAGLLALCKHRGSSNPFPDLEVRIDGATNSLNDQLQVLSLKAALPVGFEMILPTLLGMLSSEGISFQFPAQSLLMKIREKKMAYVNLEKVYNGAKSTILHSLEAFIGNVDFDRLAQHKAFGSMMASPSSTAAYLMHASVWDDESEEYLRQTVASGAGKGSGGVPSAFPSTYFEISWVISTLLGNGFQAEDLGAEKLETVKRILSDAYAKGSGIIGFGQLLEPDADDTAKAITSLNLLGVPTSASSLVANFSHKELFKTYAAERDPSITTNCNALIAMCLSPDVKDHTPAIEMALRYVCKSWWRDSKKLQDKWNISPNYSLMLITQALRSALSAWSKGVLPNLSRQLLHEMLVVLFQVLIHLLQVQREDGSWEGRRESTAYAIIAINEISSLPLVPTATAQKIAATLESGRAFISQSLEAKHPPEHLWIEKVTYGSHTLSQAYAWSALRCSPPKYSASIIDLLPEPLETCLKQAKFFKALPMFSSTLPWIMESSLVEGSLFKESLRQKCYEISPQGKYNKEKHISFIPVTWTLNNNNMNGVLSSDTMWEMMVYSGLVLQVDELTESTIESLPTEVISELKSSIPRLFAEAESEGAHTNGNNSASSAVAKGNGVNGSNGVNGEDGNGTSGTGAKPNLDDVRHGLKRFMSHMMHGLFVRQSTTYSQDQLKFAIQNYLIAQLTQAEDNHLLAAQQPGAENANKIFSNPRSSLFDWTHSTSGDHTGGFAGVTSFMCLLDQGKDPLPSSQAKYVMQDAIRHMMALCRLYNDFASIARDRAENNLSSANFPEFRGEDDDQVLKKKVLALGEYERRRLNSCLEELRPLVSKTVFDSLTVFWHTTDMYGQMYVARDLTPGVKPQTAQMNVS